MQKASVQYRQPLLLAVAVVGSSIRVRESRLLACLLLMMMVVVVVLSAKQKKTTVDDDTAEASNSII